LSAKATVTKEEEMKKTSKKLLLALAFVLAMGAMVLAGCGNEATDEAKDAAEDPVVVCNEAIEAIQVQEWTEDTDAKCAAAKEAYDALTDEQKEQLDDPDYFGLDTGDASKDDPLNQDDIGEKELLVVSFGTSFNDSRAKDVGGIEKAMAEAYPDWSVRRAFTAQIIINHIQARDGEKIDNTEQALQRAIDNGVKTLVIQPTHLMHGAEYDEMKGYVDAVKDKFDSIEIAEPMLGPVGKEPTDTNEDKKAALEAVVNETVKGAKADSADALADEKTAIVLMGHGTGHEAAVTYSQMQAQAEELGYKNVFIGTVEGIPEATALPEVKKAVEKAGYEKIILRPLMVVAGDHANNDMAGDEEGTWYYGFVNGGEFEVEGAEAPVDTGKGFGADNVSCQVEGMGRIGDVQKIYIDHSGAIINK
jgi:cobalamin biosynthesis Co2+ chelatase CbiK